MQRTLRASSWSAAATVARHDQETLRRCRQAECGAAPGPSPAPTLTSRYRMPTRPPAAAPAARPALQAPATWAGEGKLREGIGEGARVHMQLADEPLEQRQSGGSRDKAASNTMTVEARCRAASKQQQQRQRQRQQRQRRSSSSRSGSRNGSKGSQGGAPWVGHDDGGGALVLLQRPAERKVGNLRKGGGGSNETKPLKSNSLHFDRSIIAEVWYGGAARGVHPPPLPLPPSPPPLSGHPTLTFTAQCPSTRRFALFRSRWAMPLRCRYLVCVGSGRNERLIRARSRGGRVETARMSWAAAMWAALAGLPHALLLWSKHGTLTACPLQRRTPCRAAAASPTPLPSVAGAGQGRVAEQSASGGSRRMQRLPSEQGRVRRGGRLGWVSPGSNVADRQLLVCRHTCAEAGPAVSKLLQRDGGRYAPCCTLCHATPLNTRPRCCCCCCCCCCAPAGRPARQPAGRPGSCGCSTP